MKRILAIVILTILILPIRANAEELHTAKATWYCLHGTTATGIQTRPGIVASKREWMGKTMIMYEDPGDHMIHPELFMGIYEIEDTSSPDKPVGKGYVIDIWIDSYDEAKQNGVKNIIFQIIEGEG